MKLIIEMELDNDHFVVEDDERNPIPGVISGNAVLSILNRLNNNFEDEHLSVGYEKSAWDINGNTVMQARIIESNKYFPL